MCLLKWLLLDRYLDHITASVASGMSSICLWFPFLSDWHNCKIWNGRKIYFGQSCVLQDLAGFATLIFWRAWDWKWAFWHYIIVIWKVKVWRCHVKATTGGLWSSSSPSLCHWNNAITNGWKCMMVIYLCLDIITIHSHGFVMALLQWHKVYKFSEDELHRPPVVA